MGVLVLLFVLLGVLLVAYGLSLIYAPLAPVTLGVSCIGAALVLSRSVPRGPR